MSDHFLSEWLITLGRNPHISRKKATATGERNNIPAIGYAGGLHPERRVGHRRSDHAPAQPRRRNSRGENVERTGFETGRGPSQGEKDMRAEFAQTRG